VFAPKHVDFFVSTGKLLEATLERKNNKKEISYNIVGFPTILWALSLLHFETFPTVDRRLYFGDLMHHSDDLYSGVVLIPLMAI